MQFGQIVRLETGVYRCILYGICIVSSANLYSKLRLFFQIVQTVTKLQSYQASKSHELGEVRLTYARYNLVEI